ncbi:MAG: glycosyltransferase, partial [Acidilobus sp.]
MRIALVHTQLLVAGGGERLLLEMYRALKDLDHNVDLYAAYLDERAWQVITDGMGDVPEPTVLGEPPVNRLFGRAMLIRRLLVAPYWVKRLKPHYDLVIETFVGVPLRWADATYVHFPFVYNLEFYLKQQYGLRLYERAYNSLVIWMARALADYTKPVMTNSTWTAKYIREVYGNQRVYVVHPPVNVEELSSIGGERGRMVLTVSRITPEKMVAEIPKVARLVPEAEFYLVGSASGYSERTLKVIESEAEGLSNFHVETNVPRRRIIELMSQASIYLHPPFAEHFGIAIAEAAAAGL